MREILFRGKRKNDEFWLFGDLRQWSENRKGIKDDSLMGTAEVDPATVGQYTGRKDKNGKRVFEGDILRLFTIWADGTVEPVDVPVIVQFCENDQCYVLTTKQGSHYDDFGNYGRPEYYEVIGNIHDNPELLEVGE